MSADRARRMAAQAKADEIARTVGEPIDGRPMLRIAISDSETNTRLATCFATYDVDSPAILRLVTP